MFIMCLLYIIFLHNFFFPLLAFSRGKSKIFLDLNDDEPLVLENLKRWSYTL
ncbi:hypothetical protein V6Z12_D04G209400 [Gossypium hirsutum]